MVKTPLMSPHCTDDHSTAKQSWYTQHTCNSKIVASSYVMQRSRKWQPLYNTINTLWLCTSWAHIESRVSKLNSKSWFFRCSSSIHMNWDIGHCIAGGFVAVAVTLPIFVTQFWSQKIWKVGPCTNKKKRDVANFKTKLWPCLKKEPQKQQKNDGLMRWRVCLFRRTALLSFFRCSRLHLRGVLSSWWCGKPCQKCSNMFGFCGEKKMLEISINACGIFVSKTCCRRRSCWAVILMGFWLRWLKGLLNDSTMFVQYAAGNKFQ